MTTARATLLFTLAVLALGCAEKPSRRVVVIHVPPDAQPTALAVEPAAAILERRIAGRSVIVSVTPGTPLWISAPGTCAKEGVLDADVVLDPVIAAPTDLPQIGWNEIRTVSVTAQCAEARRGRVAWREVEGKLAEFSPLPDTFSVSIRTESLQIGGSPPWGIVPISPRTRGAHLLEATWMGPRGERVVREVRIAAMARASGVPSIAIGQEVLLGGAGWHLARTNPKDARATFEAAGAPDLFRFRADVAGQFLLVDGAGVPLSIRTNTHEHVPLDCGRGECHASITRDVQTSPMTHVLRNGLEGALGADYEPACALACHAVGEPGLADQGFVDVQRQLAAMPNVAPEPPQAGAWDALPRSLRRLGGVGCTSCHGPAAIPEPTARFSILRADVCATCHDAPPRYAHVESWRTSAMARSDRDHEAASDPSCQRCHTTAGFLRTLSDAPRETTPDRAGLVGIACAACHAAHGPHGAALVREVPAPTSLTAGGELGTLDAKNRICLGCHEADAARVWIGDASARSPHASLGCASCHLDGTRNASDAHGSAHDFRTSAATCRTCHRDGIATQEELHTRARAALDGLARAGKVIWRVPAIGPDRPPHARRARAAASEDEALVQALVSVAEDRAAFVHNARFVRSVVARAESAISTR